ncbi:MAG: hypothetical protein JW791_04315 [Nanoarchaeota archaeon]|nr:hypothetical protein [Nanoarchaeota archaeon]
MSESGIVSELELLGELESNLKILNSFPQGNYLSSEQFSDWSNMINYYIKIKESNSSNTELMDFCEDFVEYSYCYALAIRAGLENNDRNKRFKEFQQTVSKYTVKQKAPNFATKEQMESFLKHK